MAIVWFRGILAGRDRVPGAGVTSLVGTGPRAGLRLEEFVT
jgi:hypothetical protein